jgi:transcriptional antiterminator NusG
MQVPTGQETAIREKCERSIDVPVLEDSFVPYYDEMRKMHGSWITQRRVLFPGYVFMVTEQPKELKIALRNVGGWKNLLGIGEEITPITPEEEQYLREFLGKDQVVHASRGIIEDDKIIVTEGPLQGKEGLIRKIDRHKRLAWLEMELMGEVIRTRVSLEIYDKTKAIYVPELKLPTDLPSEKEEKEHYDITLLSSDNAVVTLDDDQSPEQIRQIYEETKKGEE